MKYCETRSSDGCRVYGMFVWFWIFWMWILDETSGKRKENAAIDLKISDQNLSRVLKWITNLKLLWNRRIEVFTRIEVTKT